MRIQFSHNNDIKRKTIKGHEPNGNTELKNIKKLDKVKGTNLRLDTKW